MTPPLAFTPRPDRAVLELSGADRQRFLHGLVTADIKALTAGASAYGYFLTGQGRIVADVRVVAREDRLSLVVPATALAALGEHLGRYVIVDRVEIAARPDHTVVGLHGSGREAWLAGRGLAPLAAGMAAELGDGLLVAGDLAGLDGWLWVLPPDAVPAAVAELTAAGAVEVAAAAFLRERIERGVAASGVDFGLGGLGGDPGEPVGLPQEIGVADAVSTTKGCYLGQEIVARIHYRGQVKRGLVGLRFAGSAPSPLTGAAVRHEGREVGQVGSVAPAGPHGDAIGLAMLSTHLHQPGTVVEVAVGDEVRSAEVVAFRGVGEGEAAR